MPGGYLSYGIYVKLGGEREFGDFWKILGFPVITFIALCYLLVDRAVVTQKQWVVGSICLILVLAVAVAARLIR